MGTEAWVTSAMGETSGEKAVVLADSLRRVSTSKSLVVITTLKVSPKLRKTLKRAFDLVLICEPEPHMYTLSAEDYAKVHACSLNVFRKCVYLSPNMMAGRANSTKVIRNCDEIFQKYINFAVAFAENNVDSSIFLYAPNCEVNADFARLLDLVESTHSNADERVSINFNEWLMNNLWESEKLAQEFNVLVSLTGMKGQSLIVDPVIVQFVDGHPLDFSGDRINTLDEKLGGLEKKVVDYFRTIYNESLLTKPTDLLHISKILSTPCHSEPIAIVGISFRMPGGNTVDELWSLLAEGKNAVIPVPDFRWKREHSYFPIKDRKVEAGFLNVPIDEFDAKFFGFSPKEAEFLDPQQRLLLEVSWEAIEDAVVDPTKLNGTKTGVFVGSWIHDYRDMLSRAVDVDYFRTYMGNSLGSSAARLSHFFKTIGPSIGTESGCSSAITAVDMACKSLRNRTSDYALAAGVNVLLHSFESDTLEHIFSPDFRCKTFDKDANGFARAEACAVLFLKRLSDATRDNDNIWGLIRGTAIIQEGASRSFGTPTVYCESMAMESALNDANVHPKDVSFLETHGTGTAVGDPIEIMAISKVYSKSRTEKLILGSIKTNIGHTESVSGITGIVKVLLSMKNEMIPQHLNLQTLNPDIHLETIPATIPLQPVEWKRHGRPRIAGVSSFGISGTDGHAIIEEPPLISSPPLKFNQERPLHIMKISAKSTESLNKTLLEYKAFVGKEIAQGKDSAKALANMAFSANTGRATFEHRAVVIAKDLLEVSKILEENKFASNCVQSTGKQLCFLFPGQGSQYVDMAKHLYHTSPVFKNCFDNCDQILQRRYNIQIKNVIWRNCESADLSRSLYSQTSIFVIEYSLLNLWQSWGVRPDFVLGHSLGEFPAAVAAGILTFEDALTLVVERSRLIDNLPKGKMLALKTDKVNAEKIISEFLQERKSGFVDIAACNSLSQTVVAGDSKTLEEFSNFCSKKSLRTTFLAATHAFHSRHMDSILEQYKEIAGRVSKAQSRDICPTFISGLEGKQIDSHLVDANYWVKHTREKVNFIGACETLRQKECSLFLEVGPHPVLSALVLMNIEGINATCMPSLQRGKDDWSTMLTSLSSLYLSEWKGEIDWTGFDKWYERAKIKLPFYQFVRKPAWTKVSGCFKIHPLIGSQLPTALSETILQNTITLRNTSFIKDHVIGDFCVFPAAGYLEMCLAAGHSAVQGFATQFVKPKQPIVLKCMKIALPLAIQESEAVELQSIVALQDSNDNDSEIMYSVRINRQKSEDCGNEWVQHASASFCPFKSVQPNEMFAPIDLNRIQSNWELTNAETFYNHLPDIGLKFGPAFQSLGSIWKSESGILLSIKSIKSREEYLLHPIILDAMIQSIMVWDSKKSIMRKLQVPLQIGEFVWLEDSEDSNSQMYIYSSTSKNGEGYSVLVSANGTPLALMKDVEFIETTPKLIESIVKQQTVAMPKIWEEVWKPSPGPMQGYLTHDSPLELMTYSENDLADFYSKNRISDGEFEFYQSLLKTTRFAVIEALYTLGWKPEKIIPFTVNDVMMSCKINASFGQYIRYFLRSLSKHDCGILKALDADENTFLFIADPPSIQTIFEELNPDVSSEYVSREERRLILEVKERLANILVGKEDALSVLFPNDRDKPSAKKYYESLATHLPELAIEAKVRQHIMNAKHSYLEKAEPTRPKYRCLELGAGTGTFTKKCLANLAALGDDADFEYYYTDITAAFFKPAEQEFKEYNKSMVFQKYDIEKDPLEQNLCPGYFDWISAFEVIHIAKDVKQTVKRLRSLLKPGGIITIGETVHADERITFIFGLLDGYWQFQDRNFRKNHVTLTPAMWKETLTEAGFDGVSVVPFYNSIHGIISAYAAPVVNNFLTQVSPPRFFWIIFAGEEENFVAELSTRLSNVNRKCFIHNKPIKEFATESSCEAYMKNIFTSLEKSESTLEGVIYLWSMSSQTRNQAEISLPFVTVMKHISKLKRQPKVFVTLNGTSAVQLHENVVEPAAGTLLGFCKSLSNENLALNLTTIDLDPNVDSLKQIDEVFMNLWVTHKQGCALRNKLKLCPKLTTGKVLANDPLTLPNGSDRFQLVLPKTRLISDLEFTYLEPYKLEENDVEVHVKAMSLNFRDVFTIIKPIAEFENFNTVGLDYSGVISKVGKDVKSFKVGDRVMGINPGNNVSLPSHLKTMESRIIHLPEAMTYAEGATIPAVFSTVIYCLTKVGGMQKGETVLIHTASGGVGLAAIQLCQQSGVNIIATAGSGRKRTYLRSLGIQHVFNSRTTDFEHEILKVTMGRGVDIVLNSITGPGFKEASFNVLTKNGRFIEMSRLNVWTEDGAKRIRPDVFYRLVDLSQLTKSEHDDLIKDLKELSTGKLLEPLPYERFDALNIRGALSYLQKAKHIGKIVCILPELKLEKSKFVVSTPLFNEFSTYLVTGGLGGIGFEIVKWMLQNGAKHIVIVSRRSPKAEINAQITKWNESGKHVTSYSVDVGNFETLKKLLEELKTPASGFPPLRGVMHAAGVLHDGVLENQTWGTFLFTYNAKVFGSWNLHELTKHYLLEHFVLFSSLASLFGSPGQTNHSASNAYQDALAAYRRSVGLPATCINWGNWGEVGVATEVDFPGIRPISTVQALLALETFLRTQTNHMAVLNVESFTLVLKLFPLVRHYVGDTKLLGDHKKALVVNEDEFWNKIDSCTSREEKIDCFKDAIMSVMRNILKMDPEEPIGDQTDLQALGIDSLMMLEMKNGIQNIIGSRMTISINQLKDCNNTGMLAETMVSILESSSNQEMRVEKDAITDTVLKELD